MAFDIDIDGAKAEQWIRDVEYEIANAERILEKIAIETKTDPGENDTIYKGLEEASNKLEEFWNNMSKGFRKVEENLHGVIKKLTDAMANIGEEIEAMKNKIGTNN